MKKDYDYARLVGVLIKIAVVSFCAYKVSGSLYGVALALYLTPGGE